MDFYIDIGTAVLLRALRELDAKNKYRRVFLKLFRSIGEAFRNDEEFEAAAKLVQRDRTQS